VPSPSLVGGGATAAFFLYYITGPSLSPGLRPRSSRVSAPRHRTSFGLTARSRKLAYTYENRGFLVGLMGPTARRSADELSLIGPACWCFQQRRPLFNFLLKRHYLSFLPWASAVRSDRLARPKKIWGGLSPSFLVYVVVLGCRAFLLAALGC
jgi:hypothetical protein